MEVLKLDGKKYVKATSVARELGYTSDYVGQLCRSGKVDAHLVGRSWYVDIDSIRDHKSSRYRSSKKKTHEALKTTLNNANDSESVKVRVAPDSRTAAATKETDRHFYARMSVPKVKYDEDGSELIPRLTQKETGPPQKLDVRPAGAEELKVERTSQSYEMKATELPDIRFEGELSVEEASEPLQEEDAAATAKPEAVEEVFPVPVRRERSERPCEARTSNAESTVRNVLHPTDESPQEMDVEIHQQKVSFADRLVAAIEKENHESQQPRGERVHTMKRAAVAPSDHTSVQSTLIFVTASALFAFVLSIIALSTQQHYTSTAGSQQGVHSVSFDLAAVLETFSRLK